MPRRKTPPTEVPRPEKVPRVDYIANPLESPLFEEFYLALEICPETEFPDMMATLKKCLHTSVRITAAAPLSGWLRTELARHVVDGGEGAQQLALVPHQLAYQWQMSRFVIKRKPEMAHLKAFLVAEDLRGGLVRQETASMIPPLALMIRPNHVILDMCAAPGSKTSELLDMMLWDYIASRSAAPVGKVHVGVPVPTGAVLANDVDVKRAGMLSHQLDRAGSPAMGVTCWDAAIFPSIAVNGKPLGFDCIQADVLCSGDGTMRKNADIWKKWSPESGNSLHVKQLAILTRAAQLVKPGGEVVYSTCSLNPVEDEAVVSSVLTDHDNLSLVDVHSRVPGITLARGLRTWTPGTLSDGKLVFHRESSEKLPPSMFPRDMDLSRTARLLPHHNDTGGFFVALLQKDANAAVRTKLRSREVKENSNPKHKRPVGKSNTGRYLLGQLTHDYQYLSPADFASLSDFMGWSEWDHPTRNTLISETEASCDWSGTDLRVDALNGLNPAEFCLQLTQQNFIFREGIEKRIFLASENIGRIFTEKKIGRKLTGCSRYTVWVHGGVRAFERVDSNLHSECARFAHRLTLEGIQHLVPYMVRRVVFVNLQATVALLTGDHNFCRWDLLDLERRGAIYNLDSCRTRGLLEAGAVALVPCPPPILPIVASPEPTESHTPKPFWATTSPLRDIASTHMPALPGIVTAKGNVQVYVKKEEAKGLLRAICAFDV